MTIALINGRAVRADDLRALALGNFGHYTSLQVRGRAVRGLDLHLQRLHSATRELFAVELEPARVRDDLLSALDTAGDDDASMRVTVFSAAFDHLAPHPVDDVDILVTSGAPRIAADAPLRVKSYVFERAVPHIKHTGLFAQIERRHRAILDGFDDALFVDADGRVSEGSTWNVGFWDGRRVLWPDAPALRGTCERVLESALASAAVPQSRRSIQLEAVVKMSAAFACNATGVRMIRRIDEMEFQPDQGLADVLARALESLPWQPLESR